MRYLLTGASGYLAQAFASTLKDSGEDVVLASRAPISKENKLAGCEEVLINYTDAESIRSAIQGVNTIIHCAGLNAIESIADPELAERVNSENTRMLIEKSIGIVDCFVYISTIHVYSSKLSGEIDENTKTTNPHPYATSHLHGEHQVQRNASFFAKGAFSIRLANTFGVPISENSLGWDLVINELCKQAIQNQKIVLRSDPNTVRNFIPVSGATQSILGVINEYSISSQISHFNLGSNRNLTLGDVVSLIAHEYYKKFGSRIEVIYEFKEVCEKVEFRFKSEHLDFAAVEFNEEISGLLQRAYELKTKGTFK
jgi:UDP-glucose 4-epimerase